MLVAMHDAHELSQRVIQLFAEIPVERCGQMAYHDYRGLAFTPEEGAGLTASLGAHRAALLRNHGTLTLGRTVAEAFVLMDTLIKACEIQVMAQAGGRTIQPALEIVARTALQLDDVGALEGVLEWPMLLRRLARLCPDFAD